MTTNVVSMCNIAGGVALSAQEASSIAELLEPYMTADAIEEPELLATVQRVCNVLKGRPPVWPQTYQLTGKSGRGWVEIEPTA